MDRQALLVRYTRCDTVQQVLALGVSEQSRTVRIGVRGVEHQADGVENFAQLVVGRDHAENVALRLGQRAEKPSISAR